MLLAQGSPLVAGSTVEPSMTKTRIKVARSFMHQGKPQPVGTVLEVSASLATELVAMGKATKYDPPAKPAPRAPKVEAPKEPKNDLE
ncbi:MAG: hypothetical protein RLZZ524_1061 [Pseudomonadota bacterium]